MERLNNKKLVHELITRNELYIGIVENKFKNLSNELLKQKPAKDKWSIEECLIHIIKADEIYLKQFEVKIQENPKADLSYKPGWLGNWFAEGIVPKDGKITNGMKSLKVMDPQVNIDLLSKEFKSAEIVVDEFIKQQRRINGLMQLAINSDFAKIKIQTAIPLVKIKMGDAFRFVIGHNERHIWQAEKVYEFIL